jgi:hypothetical protein
MWQTGFITSLALSRWSGFVLSIKVIALLNAVMLPDKIPVTNARRMVAVF